MVCRYISSCWCIHHVRNMICLLVHVILPLALHALGRYHANNEYINMLSVDILGAVYPIIGY